MFAISYAPSWRRLDQCDTHPQGRRFRQASPNKNSRERGSEGNTREGSGWIWQISRCAERNCFSRIFLTSTGTWVPLEQGEALAQRNNVYEKLRTIFEFTPGELSPPPAPKHTTAKPKVAKKPAVPKWCTSESYLFINGRQRLQDRTSASTTCACP